MQLLDFYRRQYGSAIKRQGNGWNGPCPLCGGEPGESDRFVVWPEREESLGETCAKHGLSGIWACRRCGKSGDTIAYLMQIDSLSFKDALAELGIQGPPRPRHREIPQEPSQSRDAFTPKSFIAPTPKWQEYASRLLDKATARIFKEPPALKWLAMRGISSDAVKTYRIGYLPPEGGKYPGRWRYRSALGLEPKTSADGTVREKIFIPRGIVIPSFGPDGSVYNLRIRRHKEDLLLKADGRPQSKYMELEGSCPAPMPLPGSNPPQLAAWFVTEAELDAILIHHASGGVVGALAVRTNRGKPDARAHGLLAQAARICVALDYDSAGAEGLDFWESAYPHSRRWPTPEGKDPGEAFALGVDIRAWIAAGLPASINLPSLKPTAVASSCEPSSEQAAPMRLCREAFDAASERTDGTFPAGRLNMGGGAEPEVTGEKDNKGQEADRMRTRDLNSEPPENSSESLFTSSELRELEKALPPYLELEDVPPDVLRAWLLWRGVQIRFTRYRAPDGRRGFSWDYDSWWRARNREIFDAFMDFQEGCRPLWQWLSDHNDMKITAKNLLCIWGKR